MTLLNRQALLDAVQSALDADLAAHRDRVAEWSEFLADHRMAWLVEHGPAWLASLDRIKLAIQRGDPVTTDMLPGGQGRVATWSEPYSNHRRRTAPATVHTADRDLLALQATLNAIVDDQVSPTALRNLGITSATMQRAIRALVPAKAAAA